MEQKEVEICRFLAELEIKKIWGRENCTLEKSKMDGKGMVVKLKLLECISESWEAVRSDQMDPGKILDDVCIQ